MGLIDHILANHLHLNLIADGKGGTEIKPGWYLAVEFDYGAPTRKSRAELKLETVAWLVELATMFGDIPAQSRYLSGPLGVFALTDDYPWQETYTELSMFAEKAVLEAHLTAARTHHYYLMRRVSAKRSVTSPMKYHFFHPATLQDALGPKRQPRRNLELTRIDPAAKMICQEFIPRNHIHICLHKDMEGHIECTGDKHPIHFPPEFFSGVAREVGGKRMFFIDPRYALLKERETVTSGITKHPERHQEIIRRLEIFLAKQPRKHPTEG
jgi:hypothetical protein